MTLFLAASASAQTIATNLDKFSDSQPIEVGLVHWQRDLDAALGRSSETKRPVLVLFQEVPGCAGCQTFGREVLSQPLIVEAIEDLFLPIVVYNNRDSGADAELLKRFKEPAWNYQVVRFLDAGGNDIVPREENVWTIENLATRMIQTLTKAGNPVPNYLRTLAPTTSPAERSRVALAMSCFWTGEYHLGKIDGVVATEAGWLDGREVTLVEFDNRRLSLASLAAQAAKVRCAEKIYTPKGDSIAGLAGGALDNNYRAADDSDQNRQIARWTALAKVPALNEMQKTKINSLAPDNITEAVSWLSPRQRVALATAGR